MECSLVSTEIGTQDMEGVEAWGDWRKKALGCVGGVFKVSREPILKRRVERHRVGYRFSGRKQGGVIGMQGLKG